MSRDITPTDRAALLTRLDGIDAEGAAAELARMLDLGLDAQEALIRILEEAQAQAYTEGYWDAGHGLPNREAEN
jgi:hypothetical protein